MNEPNQTTPQAPTPTSQVSVPSGQTKNPFAGEQPASNIPSPEVKPLGQEPVKVTPDVGAGGTPPAVPDTKPAADAPAVITKDAMVELIKTLHPEEKQAVTQEKQLSPEEYNKLFNVPTITSDHIEQLFKGGDDAIKVMQELLQGSAKQAVTMAHYLMENNRTSLMKELDPYLQFSSQMRENQLKEEFMGKYPHLKDYEPILVEIKNKLEREGFKGSKDDVFKRISEEADRLINTVTSKQSGNGQQAISTQQQPPKMTTLSGGGQGGAGDPTSSGGGSTAKRIFG